MRDMQNKYGLAEQECQFRLHISACDGVCIESFLRLLGRATDVRGYVEKL